MTSINSCIEMDITGQIVSDSIGTKYYSGFGGQVDFVYGSAAALDGQGKAIIALSSCTGKGDSKIVPYLKHVCASAIFANAYLAQFLGISKDF
uniref:AcetylCoA_hyd_C domain-containing protein n=1 Tax=Ascaris lumbricoides TaxID=6252 RepID=A0A0M3HLE8_ASCLU